MSGSRTTGNQKISTPEKHRAGSGGQTWVQAGFVDDRGLEHVLRFRHQHPGQHAGVTARPSSNSQRNTNAASPRSEGRCALSKQAQACEATLVARPCRDSDCHQRTCRSSSSANTVLTWSPSCSELPASATTVSPTSRPSLISVSVSVTSPMRTLRVSIVFALTT